MNNDVVSPMLPCVPTIAIVDVLTRLCVSVRYDVGGVEGQHRPHLHQPVLEQDW